MKIRLVSLITERWLTVVLVLGPWVLVGGATTMSGELLGDSSLIPGAQMREESQCVEPKRRTIDFVDLMALFMIPNSASYNVLPWEVGAQPGSPIVWKALGIVRRQPSSGDIREGEAIVTINGSPLWRLGKYMEPTPWVIRLIGSQAGVHRIEIAPEGECTVPLEAQLRKRDISFDLVRCQSTLSSSEERKIYSIDVPNRKRAWLYLNVSCGSGGCSCSFIFFLNQREADQVHGLDSGCAK
jgi:hypothetical protein